MKEQTMNIKPTSEQCQVWSSQAESFAINISSQGRHGGKGFTELFNTKFAELAVQWGAVQAQQTTADAGRVLEWMRTQNRKPANLAFTDGPERQAAYWIEIAQQMVAQQTTEPGLPEAVGYMNAGHVHELTQRRISYGYVYPKKETGASVAVYTADQMHDHFAAGVRAGMARGQTLQALQRGFEKVLADPEKHGLDLG